jgi:hypothetical protein
MTSSDMNYLTIALPKGKLFAPAAKLLAAPWPPPVTRSMA